MEPVKPPFLKYEDVSAKAEDVLAAYGWDGSIPVDVEALVEFHFGLSIVPVRGLIDKYAVDGFLSLDLTEIYVDESIMEGHPSRYRFTLAHELGHLVLHSEAFRSLDINTKSEWVKFYLGLEENDYGWFERQAYWFAGALLVPEEPLIVQYESVLAKLESRGVAGGMLSVYSRTQLAGAIAKRFEVSTGVVQRRLKEVGVW